MWIALRLGAPQVLQEVWDAEVGFDAMQRTGVTFVQAATPFLADLARVAARPRREARGGCGRSSPPAPRSRASWRARRARRSAPRSAAPGARPRAAWAARSCPASGPSAPGAPTGARSTGSRLRIVDDDGPRAGRRRARATSRSTPTLFEGYLNRPELTAEALTADGWYRTGDLARIDADGYLRITGRVKDVINRGGEKVPVAEIEQLLYAHPAVREVAIVAMPDERLGERACAFVVLDDGARARLRGDARVPRRASGSPRPTGQSGWSSSSQLPRTPSGKIQKFVLRDAGARAACTAPSVTT